jgi:hypothetical protein
MSRTINHEGKSYQTEKSNSECHSAVDGRPCCFLNDKASKCLRTHSEKFQCIFDPTTGSEERVVFKEIK